MEKKKKKKKKNFAVDSCSILLVLVVHTEIWVFLVIQVVQIGQSRLVQPKRPFISRAGTGLSILHEYMLLAPDQHQFHEWQL